MNKNYLHNHPSNLMEQQQDTSKIVRNVRDLPRCMLESVFSWFTSLKNKRNEPGDITKALQMATKMSPFIPDEEMAKKVLDKFTSGLMRNIYDTQMGPWHQRIMMRLFPSASTRYVQRLANQIKDVTYGSAYQRHLRDLLRFSPPGASLNELQKYAHQMARQTAASRSNWLKTLALTAPIWVPASVIGFNYMGNLFSDIKKEKGSGKK